MQKTVKSRNHGLGLFNSSIGSLSGATTPGQNGPGSDGNKGVLHSFPKLLHYWNLTIRLKYCCWILIKLSIPTVILIQIQADYAVPDMNGLLFYTNHSIQASSFICTQLIVPKNCNVTPLS